MLSRTRENSKTYQAHVRRRRFSHFDTMLASEEIHSWDHSFEAGDAVRFRFGAGEEAERHDGQRVRPCEARPAGARGTGGSIADPVRYGVGPAGGACKLRSPGPPTPPWRHLSLVEWLRLVGRSTWWGQAKP